MGETQKRCYVSVYFDGEPTRLVGRRIRSSPFDGSLPARESVSRNWVFSALLRPPIPSHDVLEVGDQELSEGHSFFYLVNAVTDADDASAERTGMDDRHYLAVAFSSLCFLPQAIVKHLQGFLLKSRIVKRRRRSSQVAMLEFLATLARTRIIPPDFHFL